MPWGLDSLVSGASASCLTLDNKTQLKSVAFGSDLAANYACAHRGNCEARESYRLSWRGRIVIRKPVRCIQASTPFHRSTGLRVPLQAIVSFHVAMGPPLHARRYREEAAALEDVEDLGTEDALRSDLEDVEGPEGVLQPWPVPQLQRKEIWVGSRRIVLVQPKSEDEVLDMYIARGEKERDPYWCCVWPAATALFHIIMRSPGLVRGKRVCDLGAGLGLGGVAALLAGAREVVLLDREPLALLCGLLTCYSNCPGGLSSNLGEVLVACGLDGLVGAPPQEGRVPGRPAGMASVASEQQQSLAERVMRDFAPCCGGLTEQPAGTRGVVGEGASIGAAGGGGPREERPVRYDCCFLASASAEAESDAWVVHQGPGPTGWASLGTEPEGGIFGGESAQVVCALPFDWGKGGHPGTFDTVVASDVLYEERAAPLLAGLLPGLVRPSGGNDDGCSPAIIVTDPSDRCPGHRHRFLQLVRSQGGAPATAPTDRAELVATTAPGEAATAQGGSVSCASGAEEHPQQLEVVNESTYRVSWREGSAFRKSYIECIMLQ